MKFGLSILTIFFLLNSCSPNRDQNQELLETNINRTTQPKDSTSMDKPPELIIEQTIPNYSTETFFTEGKGWGYTILMDGKPYINQPHIPAVPGNKGFSDKNRAQATADFAIYKIESGIMPPTISKFELDSLGVLD